MKAIVWILSISVLLAGCVVAVSAPAVQAPGPTTAAEEATAPQALVTTAWLADHLSDAHIRIIDLSGKPEVYAEGHLPGAVYVNWQTDLTDPDNPVRGQIPDQAHVEALLGRLGVTPETTLILYDDTNSLFATRAFWTFKYYGHEDVRILDGGRKKWAAEGRELTTETPTISPTTYTVTRIQPDIRAELEDVRQQLEQADAVFIDARNPKEYIGQDVRSARGGHIPGAVNLEWTAAVNADGTFKPVEELQKLYTAIGVDPNDQVYTYCQTGVRAAHTWFVLTQLLGYDQVVNYDGSWEEWGNRTDVPVEQ